MREREEVSTGGRPSQPPDGTGTPEGIVWLASYPKSGNTWFRAFLTNLLRNGDEPASINELLNDPIPTGRWAFEEAVGFDSGDLTFEEVDELRPEVCLYHARTAGRTLFCKVHDAYTRLPDGRPLFPAAATVCVLYLIRNPLDVCVSFAHHRGREEYDGTVRLMGDPEARLAGAATASVPQLRQRLLTWSGHVSSWVDAPDLRVHVVRYEDMKSAPEATFRAAARFAGLPDETERVARAVEFSRFDELRRQEERTGFAERSSSAPRFFREGGVGSWRQELTAGQVAALVRDHRDVMARFGYLTLEGRPTF